MRHLLSCFVLLCAGVAAASGLEQQPSPATPSLAAVIPEALAIDEGEPGTPAFAAPEQLLGEPQGPTVDLFAVAGIVAFALSGNPPFPGRDASSILAQQLANQVDVSLGRYWLTRLQSKAPTPAMAQFRDWLLREAG